MAEILIGSPTLENFNNYRRALINITRCYPADECSMEQAAHRVTNLIDNAI